MMMTNKVEAVEGNLGEKKKAVLIGLKHPWMNNSDDVKGKILRMKKFLMDLRGFPEDNITLLIQEEEEDESRTYTQPTEFNIRAEACHLVEHANPGDTLFMHIIAHGCYPFSITSSDKQFIGDDHFRTLLNIACSKGCTLTMVSDCLIEPEAAQNSVCCSKGIPTDVRGDWERFCVKHNVRHVGTDYKGFSPTGLYPVTVLKKVHMLSGLLKSIFPMRKSSLPNSCVILFNAFQGGQMKAIWKAPFYDIPELFFPPPGVASSTTTPPPNQHRLYGGFTTTILDILEETTILDILEETHGQVTNVELFQMAMEKLKMQGIRQKPGLHSNHHHHADAPFCSAD